MRITILSGIQSIFNAIQVLLIFTELKTFTLSIKRLKIFQHYTLFLFNNYSPCVDFFNARSVCSEASLLFFQFYAHKVFDYIFRTTLENILLEIVKKVIHLQFSRLVRVLFLRLFTK